MIVSNEKIRKKAFLPLISPVVYCLVAVIVCFSGPLWALDPTKPVDRYFQAEWGPASGLKGDTVYAISQSSDGYLWISAGGRLYKYDGKRFQIVKVGEYFLTAVAMHVDREGILWLGTNMGNVFQYIDGKLVQVIPENNILSGHPIFRIYHDSFGNTWFGTRRNHLIRYKGGKMKAYTDVVSISSILEDSGANLWIGAYSQGLWLLKSGCLVRYHLDGLPDSCSIYNIFEDRNNRLWVCTDVGVASIENPLNQEEKRIRLYTREHGLSDNMVFDGMEDSGGNLWLATGNGLNRIRRQPGNGIRVEALLKGHIIQTLFEDRERSLWLGTLARYLKCLRDSTFTSYVHFKEFTAYRPSLFKASDGAIWMGNMDGRLLRFPEGRLDQYTIFLESNRSAEMEITAIEEDGAGNLWLGTHRKGFFRFRDGKLFQPEVGKKAIGHYVTSILFDGSSRLWVGTTHGAFCRNSNGSGWTQYGEKDGLPNPNVEKIHESPEGDIWLCTRKGVLKLTKGEWGPGKAERILLGLDVTQVYDDPDSPGVKWLATFDSGLKRWEGDKMVSYTSKIGLGDNTLLMFLEDEFDNFWIASTQGVLKVSKQELNDYAAGRISSIDCVTFGKSDGMKRALCMNRAGNTAVRTPRGEFWFTTHYGISVVDPRDVKINKLPPQVVLKEIRFNGSPLSPELYRSNKPYYGIRNLEFHFAALTFLAPEKVAFKVKLEGYDDNWVQILPQLPRRKEYRDLPFGEYTFKVTACNNNGVWNNTGAIFSFTLKPYFYQTVTFKMAMVLLLVGFLAGVYWVIRKYIYFRKIENKYKHSNLQHHQAEEYMDALLKLMDEEKPYLDEELSLKGLAEKLSVAPRHLSQMVNERLNRNFSDFINGYRVEEAKKYLSDPRSEHSVLEVCFEVGFNSRTSFYRAFKKVTGMSPTEYKKKMCNGR